MKRLLWLIVLVVALVGVGYVLLVTLYSPESQRAELERRLSAAFGRPAHVGSLRLTFEGGLGVEARDVRVDRDSSFGDGALLEIERASAEIGFWNYLVHRGSGIKTLRLESPRLTLVKREDGVWNWSTLGRPDAGAPTAAATAVGGAFVAAALPASALPSDPARVTPSRIMATNAEVVLVNKTTAPATETPYKGLSLDTAVEPVPGAYRLLGRVAGDSAAAGGEPLDTDMLFDLTLDPPDEVPVWRARGNVPSGRFATRNVRLDSVSTDLALDETQTLRLEPFALGLYGGAVNGRFAMDLSTPNNRFTTTAEAKNVSIGDALAPRPDLGGALRGQASGTFRVDGELGDFDSTLASLVGDGHVVLDGAQLTSVNLLSEITRQGGFQQIAFDEPGTRADRIESDMRVENGRFVFSNAKVTGINGYADVRGDAGWLDLKSPATLHLEGAATLLPPLFDKIAQANPAAGALIQMIAARPNLTIPLTVDGPLTKPSVAVRWTAVAGLPF